MEIIIQTRVKNPSLKREEVETIVNHEGGTPNINDMQQELSKELKVKKELVVISKVTPKFGIKQLKVKVHIYENADAMKVEVSKGRKEKKKAEPKKE
jgi:ribosomal protein S24E